MGISCSGPSVTGTITGSQIEVDNVVTDFLETSSGNFTIITGTTIDFGDKVGEIRKGLKY